MSQNCCDKIRLTFISPSVIPSLITKKVNYYNNNFDNVKEIFGAFNGLAPEGGSISHQPGEMKMGMEKMIHTKKSRKYSHKI